MNLSKVKKAFDEVPEKKRTEANVKEYNDAINEMNAAVGTYNSANQSLNKKRSTYIDNWNVTAEKFTNTHVPKGK